MISTGFTCNKNYDDCFAKAVHSLAKLTANSPSIRMSIHLFASCPTSHGQAIHLWKTRRTARHISVWLVRTAFWNRWTLGLDFGPVNAGLWTDISGNIGPKTHNSKGWTSGYIFLCFWIAISVQSPGPGSSDSRMPYCIGHPKNRRIPRWGTLSFTRMQFSYQYLIYKKSRYTGSFDILVFQRAIPKIKILSLEIINCQLMQIGSCLLHETLYSFASIIGRYFAMNTML